MAVAEALITAALPPVSEGVLLTPKAEAARRVMGLARAEEGLNAGDTDQGYFPPGTIMHEMHGSLAVKLLYGPLGLAVGASDFLNSYGTIEHTRDRDRLFARLVSTEKRLSEVQTGTRAEADRATDRVFGMHVNVVGETTQDAGPYPAGTTYSAFDPERMRSTIGVITWATKKVFETTVRPLSDAENEQFTEQSILLGRLFGLSAEDETGAVVGPAQYMQQRLDNGEIYYTEGTKSMGKRTGLEIPVPPGVMRVARWIVNQAMVGMMPEPIRKEYDLSYGLWEKAKFHGAVAFISIASKIAGELYSEDKLTNISKRFFKAVAREERDLQEQGIVRTVSV
jgi:uncharacterized protein (DUF2236 family)